MTTKGSLLTSVAAAAALSLAVAAGPVTAQEQYDEATINSFAVAAVQLQQIGESAQQQLQATESMEQQQQIQMEAQMQMQQAVESEGLTVDQYNEIATAAQADPELAARIDQHITQGVQ